MNADDEGLVTIFGSVPTVEAYQDIETLAYEVPGVQNVNFDEVEVIEPTQY